MHLAIILRNVVRCRQFQTANTHQVANAMLENRLSRGQWSLVILALAMLLLGIAVFVGHGVLLGMHLWK